MRIYRGLILCRVHSSTPVAARADDVQDIFTGVDDDGIVPHRHGEPGDLRRGLSLAGGEGDDSRSRTWEHGGSPESASGSSGTHLGSKQHQESGRLRRVCSLEQ